MEITEAKVRLVEDRTARLKAFCTVTLDREFVVRDIKIIDGAKGLFVAMPSRKVTDHCPKCHSKNHLRAKYCNDCGTRLPGNRSPDPTEASSKLHVDVAHPINTECRSRIQKVILDAYEAEVECSRAPGYVAHSLDIETHAPARPHASEAHTREKQPPEELPASPPPAQGDKPFGAGLV